MVRVVEYVTPGGGKRLLNIYLVKVQIFWEWHKILKISLNSFDITYLNSIAKKIGRFFQKCLAFLEYLNFRPKNGHDFLQKKDEDVGKRVGKMYPH